MVGSYGCGFFCWLEPLIIVGAVACPAREIIGSFAGQASLTPTLIGCSKKLTRIGANYRKVRIYAYRTIKLKWCEAYPPCELQLGGRGTTAGGGRYHCFAQRNISHTQVYIVSQIYRTVGISPESIGGG